jgi:glycosyltransferase involved in cell wall biosynthesis
VRLAVYEDAIYHRQDGVLSVHRAFPTFMAALAGEVDHLVQLGRLDPAPARSHYVLPPEVEFVALPHYASLTHPVQVLRALGGSAARFWKVLGRVDAVWLNGPSPMAVLFALLAALRGRRVVLGVRQDTMEYARSRHPGRRAALVAFRAMDGVWRALARVHPVTAVGAALAAQYRDAHELSVSFISEDDIVERALPWEGELRVLSVGRLETEKNPLLLADILAALVRGGGRWKLVVCGEGDLRPALEARLAQLGVAEHAELIGYVPLDAGLIDVYRSSHAFLHVSWTEGLPQVLLEAFAARLPTVATAVGGVPALAEGAALLVPPGDAEAAAAGLQRLAAEPELRERLSAEAAGRVRARTREAELRRLARLLRG